MNLLHSIKWMFIGSIVIGLTLNGMNVLAYRFSDLYLSATLLYSALLMASNMCILEVFMYYDHTGKFKTKFLLLFLFISIILIIMLRKTIFN